MPIYNADIADVFNRIADYLEIEGDNPFRIRAYRNAARTVRGLGSELKDLVARGEDLTRLPGIGKELAAKIEEILETGTARALVKLQQRVPASLAELLKLPNLGPRRVRMLYRDLGIRSLEDLLKAARDGRIRTLPGFGDRTEKRLLEAAASLAGRQQRFLRADVKPHVEALVKFLSKVAGVARVEVAGSYRRARETVGDLDVLVSAADGSPVMQRFADYEAVKNVLSRGTTRASVVLDCGLQVDLRLVPAASFGAAWQYFTGSQAHNIALRRLGRQQGLKINEYGVFRGDRRQAGRSEASVYRAVGLPRIAAELRENRGEIEAARDGRLLALVQLSDLKGDLHVHTRASDGHHSIAEMAAEAKRRGLHYLAVAEHSRRLRIAGGLDADRLLRQLEEIERLQAALRGITILKGIEVDILEDGRLDLPDDVLARLDLVVGAIHSHFHLPAEQQTARVLRAMDHPHFSILAHPTGRLINEREPIALDMARVIRAARRRGCFLELNAHPRRLDLTDTYCRMAREEGVLVAINSDAHGIGDFDWLDYGVGQARRGWLEKKDVLNTRPLSRLRRLLKQTM